MLVFGRKKIIIDYCVSVAFYYVFFLFTYVYTNVLTTFFIHANANSFL